MPDTLIARYSNYGFDPGEDDLPEPVLEASRRIAGVYARLMSQGIGEELIAKAMLGATVSLYNAMSFSGILPSILRRIAHDLEQDGSSLH
jgi:hypothetical protein